jgi:allantoate deiminase
MKDSQNRRRAEEAIVRCRKLASFSEDQGSTRRTFLSPPMRDCHREITGWMKALDMSVRVDAMGNLRGFYPGAESNGPRLLLGSHLDTVPKAGAFDGILGVIIAVTLLEALEGRRLPFGIEVIGFSEEEGVRFGVPFLGSRALVGRVDEELLQAQDGQGVSVRKAIEDFGLSAVEIPQARIGGDYLGYIEFHIEQGPVLEQLGKPLAAVDSIAGQSRLEFTFLGRSNHAGTTPMHLRHDALAAAAEWIIAVERTALNATGLVASVGKIEAKPGASNVVSGEASLTLDVRHASDETRIDAVQNLVEQAKQIAHRRGLTVEWKGRLDQCAVPMDAHLVAEIERAIAAAGCAPHRMTSGAGHDAMIMAEKIPSAMIFLRTPGGISHDPAESVAVEDVEKAIACGSHLLGHLAASSSVFSSAIREGMGRA